MVVRPPSWDVVNVLHPQLLKEAGTRNCVKRSAQTFVGLDVHKREIVSAMLLPSGEIREMKCQNSARGITKLVKWMEKNAEDGYECCYEAGFCGYDLAKLLRSQDVECRVIAPSLVPVKPGERVKTDRRDAKKLAQYLRGGLLTEVAVPSDQDEALRDVCRNREDARQDLHAARQRVIKFLDRKGWFYREGGHWTLKHWAWLRGITFAEAGTRASYQDYLAQVEFQECRLKALDGHLEELAHSEPYQKAVEYLSCVRGIDWLTAIILVSELYDPSRFRSARALMGYVGLTPSEKSSGEKERRGGLTGSGNRILRRIVIEIAWHQRRSPSIGKALRQRREGQPGHVIAYADRAMVRLSSRFYRLSQRRKHPNVVAVAVARELVGFLWGLLCSGEFLEDVGSDQGLDRAA